MRTTSIMKKPSLKFLISIAAITVISIGVSGALTAPRYKIAANAPAYDYSKLQKEKLGRGVVAIRENQSEVAVSWRYLSSDPVNTSFNLYRDGKKVAEVPATTGTFYRDTYESKKAATYTIKPVVDGAETGHIEGSYTLPANAPTGYINIPLNPPTDGTTPAGQKYTYIPNDASIGDVNGDGVINSGDSLLLMKHLVGQSELNETQRGNADVDKNEVLNSKDALLILQFSNGSSEKIGTPATANENTEAPTEPVSTQSKPSGGNQTEPASQEAAVTEKE